MPYSIVDGMSASRLMVSGVCRLSQGIAGSVASVSNLLLTVSLELATVVYYS
jgi:hypothetical protein